MRAASAVLFFLAATAKIRTAFAVADGDDDGDDIEENSIADVSLEMTPTSGQAMPTDNFVVEWSYDGYLTGVATMDVFYYWADEDDEDYGVPSTTVDWSESSISLPPRFLPHVHPGSSSSISLVVYTVTGSADGYPEYFTVDPFVRLYASATSTPPVTITHTVTPTQTDDPAPTSPTPDNDSESESGGLTTGGKAGIGVGVSAGAILVAAGAFLFVRRRKRQEPKTIREIPATSATNLPGAAP